MPELAYVNGNWGPIEGARVSIDDRGFQFGDGIYEVLVAYDGKPFLLQEHLARFRGSAAGIRLDYDFTGRPLEPIIREGLRRSGFADAVVYIQVTRGAAPRSHVIPAGLTPTVVMTFKPLPVVAEAVRDRGIAAMTTRDIRWANCYVKAITLLPNILAKNEAIAKGFDEAIFVTEDGEVRECTSANIFVVRGGRLYFPPRNHSVLHGITQGFLMECADGIGMPVREEPVAVAAMMAAEEVFLSSTLQEVLGIVSIDGKPVGDGRVGRHTKELFREFRVRSRGGARQAAGAAVTSPNPVTPTDRARVEERAEAELAA
jgi:D-alanine transaminase